MRKRNILEWTLAVVAMMLLAMPVTAADRLPNPDGKPADMSKPVQVYILMGQSNMLGFGKINPSKRKAEGSLTHAVKEKKKYLYLVDDAGNWTVRKDVRNVRVSRYEQNLVHLIKQLRTDFDAPSAKFVCATLGQTEKGAPGDEGEILEAQLAVDGKTGKYKEFKGNVATVYTKPLSQGGASNGHYGGNAETYMNVGEAMGRAMVELLKADSE